LNVKPDHLDRHGSFEEYKNTKAKIAQNLNRKDVLILNLDDDVSKKMILHKNYQFFSKNALKRGIFVNKNQIYINKKSVLSLSSVHLKGDKNLENVLAAVSICSHFHVTPQQYDKALTEFVPASHRMEEIGKIDGVTYIDDSKATNVASTIACVEGFKNEKIWLLLGGLGKEIDYGELFSLNYQIKEVVCFGSDREKIAESAKSFGYQISIFEKFVSAVLHCKQNATSGDFVILSPACASFDEFSSFSERGEKFKEVVLGQIDEK
jgi:UDP-N-acetylmuramoylalanine--D-glutamate ligase